MLDTRRTPDISDLGIMSRRYLDIAEVLEKYACSCDLPNNKDDRQTAERLCSAVVALTDALREVSAVASVLDGFEEPEYYGFPPEPIQKPHTYEYKAGYDAGFYDGLEKAEEMEQTILRARKALKAADAAGQDPDSADGSYLAGYADGLTAADNTDGKGYTLEDGESLADFARRVQNLTAEQLDDLTADEEKKAEKQPLTQAERQEVIAEILENLRALGFVTDSDDGKGGAEQ